MKNFKSKWQLLFIISAACLFFALIRLFFVEKELALALKNCEKHAENISENEDIDINPDENPEIVKENEESINDSETVAPEAPVLRNTFSFSIPVTASFYNTFGDSAVIADMAKETGQKRLSELLSAHIARNLVFSLDIRKDLYPGDQISSVFRIITDEEKKSREDMPDDIEIVAMKYESKKLKKSFSFYSFKPSSRKFPAFFDEHGHAIEKPLKNSPLKEWIQITSVLKDRRPKHDGIDFKALAGTPVYAPWSGRVLRTNWKTRYNGFSIEAEMNTNPKIYMILLHLDKVHVKKGDTFKQGDHLADVGNTGRSFAPHLHYQLQKEPGKTRAIIDPLKYHGTIEWKLPENDIEAFRKIRDEFDKLMK